MTVKHLEGLLTFSQSQVAKFKHGNKHLRWGQAFHQFMKLEKITNEKDKAFCDRLYNEVDNDKARAMVTSRTDFTQ